MEALEAKKLLISIYSIIYTVLKLFNKAVGVISYWFCFGLEL